MLADQRQTCAVLLTPPGRAAVASVLVTGADALGICRRLFFPQADRPLGGLPWNRIRFGRWGAPDGEEVVVTAQHAEQIEIHGHGGSAGPQAILDSLAAAGCLVLPWKDWLERTATDGIQSAAAFALAAARSERTAGMLLDQYQGALREAILRIERAVFAIELDRAAELTAEVLQFSELGAHLTEPWQVVLAGPANVGKSSLINALLGYSRAIVCDTPGTTRDVVSTHAVFDGWPVELSDTAGLRETEDELEAAGVELAEARLHAADLVVLVFDVREPWSDSDVRLVARWPAALIVYNKLDLVSVPEDGRPPGLGTSAVERQGLAELEAAIVARLVPTVPPAGTAIPFTRDQIASLRQVQTALPAHDPTAAQRALTRLTINPHP